jgi:hypothetical protein
MPRQYRKSEIRKSPHNYEEDCQLENLFWKIEKVS